MSTNSIIKNPQTVLITGATSGLGWELAKSYCKDGITLFLTGRNQKKLEQITKICQDKGARVFNKVIDIKNGEILKTWINQVGEQFGLDLVIANAGISAGTSLGSESENQIKEIFSTNIDGVLNTINPAIKVMQNQKTWQKTWKNPQQKINSHYKGQIAIISSLAGFRGLPSSPAYSASKACVRVYGEGLRGSLAPLGIAVSIVCPGYIKTSMTAVNDFYMPLLMTAPRAAQIIKKSLTKNKARIAFPFPLYFVVWLATLISTTITDPLFAILPKKKSL
jgi:short-subunit dehydrogenase